jgi:ketosteroid isomerase-like protein
MSNEDRKATIERYLAAYNRFDVDGMLAELAPDVRFENVAGGQVNAEATGVEAFRRLAEQGRQLFSEREQRVTALAFESDTARAAITWRGRFTVDVPGGPPAGTFVELQGESEYTFDGARIARLVDRSA